MPESHNLWIFLSASFVLWVTPGPDTVYILARTTTQGRLSGVVSVLGIGSGVLAHTLLASIGLSTLLATSAAAFTVVKCIGAAYLIYLGIQAFRRGNAPPNTSSVATLSYQKIYWQGFLTNLLNPKVAVFFLAFLPQFVAPGINEGGARLLLLGVLFVLGGTIWCLMLVVFAAYFTKAARADGVVGRIVCKAVGAVYVVLGLNLLRAKL
ncbi:LysE family translocator [Marinobacter nanhaiticus D15-8W]|uniref:LysE family translocator n=1 Tax=Marinobacter nanhaiticus D15-8W TaxID=626887 RepID=N6VSR3_9GAMM|nr:LysE family translocator [Marinobacter nanhaiticus]ENO13185.2 LysE family translocator [Marinobacter nanhaiticus D15-8W]BES70545.1 LysE family translocator [Marinobacter nanhaiticus D15-8W]